MKAFVLAFVLVALVAPAAVTAAGNGQYSATIRLAPVSPAGTAFEVTRGSADNTVYWVYNYCWDGAGLLVSTEAFPVVWPSFDSLTGTTGYAFTLSGVRCEALVTIKPWNAQPLKGAVLDYTV